MSFADKPDDLDVAINANTPLGASPERAWPLTEGSGTDVRNLGSATRADPAADTFDMTILDYDDGLPSGSPVWGSIEGCSVTIANEDKYLGLAIPLLANETWSEGHLRLRVYFATLPTQAENHAPIIHSGGGTGLQHAAFKQGLYIGVSATKCTVATQNSGGTPLEYDVAHSASGVTAGTAFDIDLTWGTAGFKMYVNGVEDDGPGTHTEGIIIRTGSWGVVLGACPFAADTYQDTSPFDVVAFSWTNDDGADTLDEDDMASLREDPHWPIRKCAPFTTYVPQLTIRAFGQTDAIGASMTLAPGSDELNLRGLIDSTSPPSTPGTTDTETQGANPQQMRARLRTITGTGVKQFYSMQYAWSAPLGGDWYDLYADSVETGKAAGTPIIGSFEDVLVGAHSRFAVVTDAHQNEATDTAIPRNGTVDPPVAAILGGYQTAIDLGAALIIDAGDWNRGGGADGGYPPDADTQAASDAWELNRRNVVLRDIHPNAPILHVLGNHEGTGSYDASYKDYRIESIKRYVGNPAGGTDSTYDNYGSIVFGLAEHFWIDPYTAYDAESGYTPAWYLETDQEDWLGAALAASTATYKFVHAHQLIGGSVANGNYGRGGPAVAVVKRAGTYHADVLHPMLVANGVTAYFYGHDHGCAHGLVDGVHYIVAAAVGRHFGGAYQTQADGYAGPNVLYSTAFTGFVLVTLGTGGWSFKFIRTVDGVHYGGRRTMYGWPNRILAGG